MKKYIHKFGSMYYNKYQEYWRCRYCDYTKKPSKLPVTHQSIKCPRCTRVRKAHPELVEWFDDVISVKLEEEREYNRRSDD